MARTHKFLILEGCYNEYMDLVKHDVKLIDRIHYTDPPMMRVIECRHEIFDDNCVDLHQEDGETANFVQAVDGTLYYWEDVMTRFEVIEAFE